MRSRFRVIHLGWALAFAAGGCLRTVAELTPLQHLDGGAAACWLNGQSYEQGSVDPDDPCLTCDTSLDGGTFVALQCPAGMLCARGVCRGACQIGGVSYRAGAYNPSDPSTCCNPDLSAHAWIARFIDGGVYGLPEGVGGSLISADLKRDGNVDLVANLTLGGGLVLLTNEGGVFSVSSSFDPSDEDAYTEIAAIDLRGDGWTAIARSVDQEVRVYENDRDGGLLPYVAFPSTVPGGIIVAADFDGDGITDLIVLAEGPPYPCQMAFLRGDGHGSLSSPVVTPDDCADYGTPATFRGNGIIDIAESDKTGRVLDVWRGTGKGTFPTIDVIDSTFAFPAGVQALTHVDLNRDGYEDLVAGYGSSAEIYLGNGDGGFLPRVEVQMVAADAIQPVIADLDGDGLLDIALDNFDPGQIGFVFQLPDGGFTQPGAVVASGSSFVSLVAADLNGDGATDLADIDRNAPPAVHVFINACP
jgi:hypothetical protein